MYALLNTVDEHIKENGIPFKNIEISSKYFPASFNQAIINYLKKNNPSYKDENPIPNYIINHTLGKTRLIVTGNDNHNTLVIFSDDTVYDKTIPGKLLSEGSIIKHADDIERANIEKLLQDNIISPRFLKNIEDVPHLSSIMINIGRQINEYIDYLNYIYTNQLLEEKDEKTISFLYTTPTPSPNNPSHSSKTSSSKERYYNIISIKEREDILEQYNYLYRGIAINNKNNEIDSINYLYKLKENCYVLIMEPYKGDKHTKILHLYLEENITKDLFVKLTKRYLELPRDIITMTPDLTRHNHTTVDYFEKLISSVLTQDYHNLHTATKTKIKKAQSDF